MKRISYICVAFCVAAMLAGTVLAQPGSADGLTYKTGYSVIVRLGIDLQKALKPDYRRVINSQPVSLETDVMPFIKPYEYAEQTDLLRVVFISVGFVDLVNNVAHAKAIDQIERGFFENYILSLSKESGEMELHELPRLSDKRFWTEDLMNEQLSDFNQMVGLAVAINMAHHYLGHYKKYADKLNPTGGKPVPITSLLTEAEWEEAVRVGVRNSLDCGLGIDGPKALYGAIIKMPQRPAWTSYFLPTFVKDMGKVKKTLERIEKDFFAGKLK